MIVRLKVCRGNAIKYILRAFQFYDSPIKRINTMNTWVINKQFQFYDSPIKSK